MPRIARAVAVGVPHHVTQRGNNRQGVFFADGDRSYYLTVLRRNAARFKAEILGYCLMTNHVHLVVIPRTADALAKTIGRTNLAYARHANRLHGRSGHLWQNRFFSCALDEGHCWRALRYVERNPVRARLVKRAWEYRWSSAHAHVGCEDATGLLDLDGWRKRISPDRWKAELQVGDSDAELEGLRGATRGGRPLGSESFVAGLERRLSRTLHARSRGRPRGASGGEAAGARRSGKPRSGEKR
ncbi:MAG: transposase [Planctomycetes bacterium]|nr:transposase [Planctomycetota bacterium]